MIKPVPSEYKPNEMEKKIIKFWRENKIFEKSVEQRKDKKPYVFLEGPPTANGLPHPGHVLTRIMKDVVLRYKTMDGYYVPRRAGWDTHGLPVEIEVEKKLGLESKQDIEKYGVEKFNEECCKSTFKYEQAWIDMTERVGFWIDMKNPYITLKNEYIESVWWSLKQAWEKKLLYKGYKVVPYCPRCGTVLSAHEVAQGYKKVKEPSIFVKFKIKNENAYFLAWTTTPWTLISNVALAVHPDEYYVKIKYEGETLILAEERAYHLLKDSDYELLDRFKGKELEYKEYEPIFSFVKPDKKAWYVICADFVTMDEGTGIVHIAPAFGEEDYEAGREYDLPVVQLVRKNGTFKDEVEPWANMFVKDADPKIIKYLQEKGFLAGEREYTHEYPFCWRCDSPLLYYAMESWFIAMSKLKEKLVENNNNINWYPEYIKHGRFGDFIRDVKDWALSRDRYWGTPLPIWKCNNCGETICIGSIEELKKLSENFPENYDLHKPFIDNLKLKCPKCNSNMKREKDVIDCWYDSGSAFFAQWHYPFENQQKFKKNYPVDFICEALDQTRGWFYSLLAISTMLFGKHPYKNVLTLGLVLDKEGQKMSKSKKNYVDPNTIFENEGSDALRWYLFSTNAPWMPIRFYEDAIKETLSRFILTLWHSYNFFATYATLDNFNPEKNKIQYNHLKPLDKWIISRFNNLIRESRKHAEKFEMHKVARAIEDFIVEDLSNWYIRRSRKRLWVEEQTEDKLSAYSTMYEIFLELSKLLAPFTPFITEQIYQSLKTDNMPESIHLCDYPTSNKAYIDEKLEKGMQLIIKLAEEGRTLRAKNNIKIRQPLSRLTLVTSKENQNLIKDLLDLLKEEINIKEIKFSDKPEEFISKKAIPNISKLGPKYKGKTNEIVEIIKKMKPEEITNKLEKNKEIVLKIDEMEIKLSREDFDIIEETKENIAKADIEDVTILLDTTITPELKAEGLAREIVRRIQSMRKELNLEIEDRIQTEIKTDKNISKQLEKWIDYIKEETRSKKIVFTNQPEGKLVKKWDIDNTIVLIGITK